MNTMETMFRWTLRGEIDARDLDAYYIIKFLAKHGYMDVVSHRLAHATKPIKINYHEGYIANIHIGDALGPRGIYTFTRARCKTNEVSKEYPTST